MKNLFAALMMAGAALLLVSSNQAGDKDKGDKKPEFKITEVMQKAMKGGLCGKVAKGEANEAEKKELAALFLALHHNTPPKGEPDSWKAKTAALLDAAKGVLEGKKGAEEALMKAANCAACHKIHKGK